MTLYVPENYYSFELIWTNQQLTKNVTCTLGLRDTTTLDIRDPQDVANDLWEALTGDGFPALCAGESMALGWQFLGVEGYLMTDTGPIMASNLNVINGTGSDNDVPVNCSIMVKKNTALGGRRNRGRWYLPPIMAGLETDTDGRLVNVSPSVVDAGIQEMVDSLDAINMQCVLFHTPKLPSDPEPTPTDITSFVTQPRMATQRRRMR